MKTPTHISARLRRGFTMMEVMFAMTITVLTVGLAMSTFLSGLKMFYRDNQRLASNGSLRTFMRHISNETLNASFYYLFDYYTLLDGNVDMTVDPSDPAQSYNNANDQYDRWIAHGDCLVLVTLTSRYRTTDIRQIRIYYRITKDQSTTAGQNLNSDAELRYYETADWGEGNPNDNNVATDDTNGHPLTSLTTYINAIDLKTSPRIAGSNAISTRSLGLYKPSSTDRYPIFSTLSPIATGTTGSISINVEFVTSGNLRTSSSSFNYTISPRR
jgi:prepilin-type N-terminal cleavage/methylation domain-containing protein